jgi:hypothetical protein
MPAGEQLDLLRSQWVLTVAMCRGDEPYLVTMDYLFVEAEKCFYVHCANEGRKLEFLSANPRIWGQIVEDRGYIPGVCSHAYRCVMFQGRVERITDAGDKRRVLDLMIDRCEPEPELLKQKMLKNKALGGVTVLRLRIEAMSGKQSPSPAKAQE